MFVLEEKKSSDAENKCILHFTVFSNTPKITLVEAVLIALWKHTSACSKSPMLYNASPLTVKALGLDGYRRWIKMLSADVSAFLKI